MHRSLASLAIARRALYSLALSCALLLGCKPGEGSKCEGDQQVCRDAKTRLVCVNGAFEAMPCKGERGCFVTPKKLNCDITGNGAGDKCAPNERGNVACADGKHQILCIDGKYRMYQCLGKGGCEGLTKCDDSVSTLGADCNSFHYACSANGKQRLKCVEGKMIKIHECRGAGKCEANGEMINCDMSQLSVGDPCEIDEERLATCSVDRADMLRCKAGKFVLASRCRGEKKCSSKQYDTNILCDDSVQEVSDPCTAEGATVCSVDGKSQLQCQDGAFVVKKTCAAKCAVATGTC